MTKIIIYKDREGHINRYTVSGHVGYDDYGKDILCAAISVLSQTALIALRDVCGLKENEISYKIDEDLGYMDVSILENVNNSSVEKAEIVLKTLEVGIKSVMESYPKYLKLEYREV